MYLAQSIRVLRPATTLGGTAVPPPPVGATCAPRWLSAASSAARGCIPPLLCGLSVGGRVVVGGWLLDVGDPPGLSGSRPGKGDELDVGLRRAGPAVAARGGDGEREGPVGERRGVRRGSRVVRRGHGGEGGGL